jgi:hypothetical protein
VQKHVGENGFFLLDHERYQIVEAFVDKSRMAQQLFELYVKPDAKLEVRACACGDRFAIAAHIRNGLLF